MNGPTVSDIVMVLAEQRDALALVEMDARVRAQVDHLIADAIVTLAYPNRAARTICRNVVGS